MYRTIKITVCCSCTIIILLMSSFAVFLRRMPVVTGYDLTHAETNFAISLLEKEYVEITNHKTKEEYRQIIEKDFNCRLYIYQELDLPEGVDGQCQPLFRIIKIDTEATEFFYCSAFAHEMIHLTSYIQQENYVNYRTFVYLFEHEDPEFHNYGVMMGIYSLYGMYPSQYDCNGDIIQYVTTKLGNSSTTTN